MKRALSLILSVLMLVSLLALPVYAEEPAEGTIDKPIYVPMGKSAPTVISLAAGQSVYYQLNAPVFNGYSVIARIPSAITVDGVRYDAYSPADYGIKVVLEFTPMSPAIVGFHNETEEDMPEITLEWAMPVGTETDPYQLEDGENAISIPANYPTYYAAYVPVSVGEYSLSASDYENFIITLDLDGDLTTTEDWFTLKEDMTYECPADNTYIPVFVMIQPVGTTPDITLTVTPPKKGTAGNPYLLSGTEDMALGVSGEGDSLWPASPEGTCYTMFLTDGTTLVVEVDGTANLMINDVEYVVTGRKEILLSLSPDLFAFNMVATTAEESLIKLSLQFPEGTENNPKPLNKGKNTLPLADTGEAYHATYVAEKDGVLLFTPHTVNGLGYTDAFNVTREDYENGYDFISAGWLDDDGVVQGASEDNVLTIPVTKGDVVRITACAGENEDFEILAMDLILTVSYEGETVVEIVTQPKTSTYGKEGATVKVTVKATGDGLKYTWYIKNAGKTSYSKSSITSATYSVKMTASSSDRRLYCVITDKYGNSVKTNTVVVRRQATITKESATVKYAQLNEKAAVKVTAAGDGLKYTWYVKNSGASKYSKSSITKSSYSVTMTDKVKGRRVYCVVTDKYGKKVQSKTFTLRMAASITTQPKTVTVKKNTTAKVTVKAKGDGLKYTWYVKNEGAKKYSKSSITKSSYSVKMTSKVKNRLVYVVVKDKYGNTVKSKTVRLKMK